MYHVCLARIFEPLKAGMTKPEIIKCPDGHFRRAVYGLGPYIADYPEQVWLAGIVQGWCPKLVSDLCYHVGVLKYDRCNAPPDHLDRPISHRRTHEKTDFLVGAWDPGTLWNDFGIRADVVVRGSHLFQCSYSESVTSSRSRMAFLELTSMSS
jgi:hypothetical protein